MLQLTNPQETLKVAGFLTEALQFVDAWTPTDINAGGCGVFAKLLSEKLTEANIPHEIWALYFRKKDDKYEVALKNYLANGGDLKKAGEDHVCIKVYDVYLDSTGIINAPVNQAKDKLQITPKQLDDLIENGKWNPTFDRKCIGFIKEKLQEAFDLFDTYVTGAFKYPVDGQVVYTDHTMKYNQVSAGDGFGGLDLSFNNFLSALSNNDNV